MKIRVIAAVLAVIALPTGPVFSKTSTDPYSPKIEIVNKAKLPPARLADALFAKYILANEDNREWMIQYAAKLNPSDPVYAYLLVPRVPPGHPTNKDKKIQDWFKKRQDNARNQLDKILAKHPSYWPALYKRAFLEPTLDRQLKALEIIAQIDKDNAVPYYMMADLRYRNLVSGRKRTDDMFPLSNDEWNSVTALISKGNNRPKTEFIYPRTPSAEDISVTINGKVVPRDVVKNLIVFTAGTGYDPTSFDAAHELLHSIARALAQQAASEARSWNSQGRRDEALAMLGTYLAYSKKLASAKPYRLLQFVAADSVHNCVISAKIDILKDAKFDAQATELEKERSRWNAATTKCSLALGLIMQPVNGVEIGPGEPLTYFTVASEEAVTKKILKEIGLIE